MTTIPASDAIYFNGLAQYPGRLDLTKLDQEEPGLAFRVLEMLLGKKEAVIRLQAGNELNRFFWHLYSEQRNQEKLKGGRPLGMGYPMVAARWEDQPSVLPVWIWEFHLEPSPYRECEWEIRQPEYAFHRLNPVFLDWAQQNGIPALAPLSDLPDRKELSVWLQKLALEMGLFSSSQSLALMPFPDLKTLDENADQKTLLWSAVIGVFPVIRTSRTAETLPVQFNTLPAKGHSFGMLPMDPYQASALEAIRAQDLCWVQGRTGSGKTHLITQVITMALANDQKCLVVSPTMGSLKQIQDELARLGVQKLQYLIRHPQTDTGMLMDFLRAMVESPIPPATLDTTQYKTYLDRCEREKQKLDDRYSAVRQKVFGDADWTETVGLYLRSNRVVGKELLSMQLYTQDFSFNQAEFSRLQTAIRTSYPLFLKISSLKHPLTILHPDLFLKMEKEEAKLLTNERLGLFLEKCTRLQRRYFAKVNQYGESLRKHYEQHYRELSTVLLGIKEKIAEGGNRFGSPFLESSSGALQFSSFFSGKRKEIWQEKIRLAEQYADLRSKHHLFGYFDAQLPDVADGPVANLKPVLQEFELALDNWQGALSGIIQEGIQRLSLKTVHPRLHLSDDIGELEENLDYLLDEINGAALFSEPLDHKMLTISKRQKFLEGVIEQLENTQRAMDQFGVFYDWQKNWLGLVESEQKLIRALVKVKPSNWEAALESWYFHHCLNQAYSPRLPEADAGLGALVEAYQTLQPMLADAIRQRWESRRVEAVRRLKSENKTLYQLLLDRKPGEEPPQAAEIRERWGRGLAFVSEVLPVLLVGDSAIPFLPEVEQKAFDYILIDEGQFLNEAQLARLRSFGHRVLLVSNPESEPLPGAAEWPQAWRSAGVPAMPLSLVHHRSPGNLAQLDLNRPQAAASYQEGQTFFFEQVKGTFDEVRKVNLPEARALITLLNRIEKTPQRTFPTVGIACLTIEQRDLVQQLLFQEKKQDREGADTIRQLERNGLGVFFVDELVGQHFDILVLSGTFGLAGGEENLTAYLQQMDSREWMARLDLLMGRANKGIFVLNSIPPHQLEAMAAQNANTGQFIYANFLSYLQTLEKKDLKKQEKIGNRFFNLPKKEAAERPLVFPEQVVQELRLYLRDQKLLTGEQAAHLSLPILVSNTEAGGDRRIVIQPDGFFGKTPATDYVWEYDQRKRLSELGYTFLPAWSVKWWKETSLEAKRLAGTLINLLEGDN